MTTSADPAAPAAPSPTSYLPTLRARGGLQSYPSRLKDPGTGDFSTGSVSIGATAALWAAVAHSPPDSMMPTASITSTLAQSSTPP